MSEAGPQQNGVATSAFYEHIAFTKINIRATVPQAIHVNYQQLVDALEEYFDNGESEFDSSHLGYTETWTVIKYNLEVLDLNEEMGWQDFRHRILVFAFRRTPTPFYSLAGHLVKIDQIVAIDRKGRFVATALAIDSPAAQGLSPNGLRRFAADNLQELIATVVARSPQLNQLPASYDVDLICSTETIQAWLQSHGLITEMTLLVRRTNGGGVFELRKAFDAELDRLESPEYLQTAKSFPGRGLNPAGDYWTQLGNETANGNAKVSLSAESGEKFDSEQSSDVEHVGMTLSANQITKRVVQALIRRLRAA